MSRLQKKVGPLMAAKIRGAIEIFLAGVIVFAMLFGMVTLFTLIMGYAKWLIKFVGL